MLKGRHIKQTHPQLQLLENVNICIVDQLIEFNCKKTYFLN